jgi:hypothetical protein
MVAVMLNWVSNLSCIGLRYAFKVMFPGNQEFLRGLKHHPQIDAEHADLCSAICENLRNLRMGV